MDGQCRATKGNGERCRGTATSPDGLCWAHAPENAAKRQRIASKAGRGRPSSEIRVIKAGINEILEGVRDGSIERSVGAVLFQGYNVLLKAVETERKIRELDEIEARVRRLEGIAS